MKSLPRFLTAIIGVSLLVCPVLPASGGEGQTPQVKVIQGPQDIPDGFCSLARKGDLLVFDGRSYAVVGTTPRSVVTSSNYPYGQAMGSLLGFVPADQALPPGDLNIGAPVLRLGERTHHLGYSALEKSKDARGTGASGYEARGVFEDRDGRRAEIRTLYVFDPEKGGVEITSTLTNTGKSAFEKTSFSLFFDAYGRFNFSPFEEKRYPQLNYRVYQKMGHFLGWLSFNPVEKGESRYPGRLLPGESAKLRHTLLAETSGQKLISRIYDILGVEPARASVSFKNFEGPWLEFTAREVLSSSVFFRTILENPSHLEVPLPPGIYRFQANFFPGSAEELVEVKPDGKNGCLLKNPPLGEINVRIRDGSGNPVAGKVSFIGLGATKSPYFRPDNPVETGKAWENSKNSCFPPADGLDVELPAGTYLATASRGPEYTIDQKVVEIVKEENRALAFVIDRVVDTPGLVALDPHLHTTRSDGSMSVSERVKSVVAEGIEVMAATDHNVVTDYAEALKTLRLDGALTVLAGCEVTVPEVIHYNTYPMRIRPDEPGNGAINASGGAAGPLFKASREKNPGTLIQVNHPRAGDLGYFNNFNLDQASAATALAALDTGFDVLEVMNGPYFYSSNETAIQDWFHLLNRGYLSPIVGSSDSHGIDRSEPGYSRTYVYCPDSGPAPLDAQALLRSIRQGRSFATNGPIIDFRVNGQAGPGEVCPAPNGRVEIRIGVKSAPWIAVDEVRLVLNGERRIVFQVDAPKGEVEKFEQQIGLTLQRDAYLCVEALGKETLFPVLQSPARNGSIKGGTLPFAITNPVFVDVDGNRKFDAALPEKIRPAAESAGPRKKVPRL
ncbi:MAG: hypothetical protein A2W03_18340 [Candidatus Aminicenantes bacterium RBG_16_63_16]|nr:MAG: hypothetical protein A2W03_18340 [Candidatus Aminicenantes bacterium RBG_16_63_16]